MSPSRVNDPEAGLLRMLREALRAGLLPGADDEAFAMTRSAAQIIGLRGLETALDALEPQRAHAWSGAARELVDFIERLAAEQDLSAFRAAEDDLATRAEGLGGLRPAAVPDGEDGTSIESEPPPGTLTAREALADLPLAGDAGTERAGRARLGPQVATALRAALDWLAGDHDHARPFRLRAEDSVLEVVCEGIEPGGLTAAHEVLAAAGGNLAPLGETSARAVAGVWFVRVPAWSSRPVHLMLQQGDLRLAVPWHAVLRLSLVPSIEIEMRGGTLATPVLAPLVPLGEGIGERPVVAIALGLKRALLVADHLVWRLGAEDCEPPGPPPVAGLTRTVCSDDGEGYWVAEPALLLADVALPLLPSPGPERKPAPAVETHDAPAAPPVEAPPAAAPPEPGIAAPIVLGAEDVEPLALTAADVEPLPIPADPEPAEVMVAAAAGSPPSVPPMSVAPVVPPEPPAVPGEPPPPVLPEWLERFGTTGGPGRTSPAQGTPSVPRPGSPAVLIAEDSIAARHFLLRLFEQRGFAVHAVATAAELRAVLATRHWSIVCADVELPDSPGDALMTGLRAALDAREVPLVALVRDDEDAERAAACGVRRWLRKPFDIEEVDHLLNRLGLLAGKRS